MFGPVSPSEPCSGGTCNNSFLPTRQSQTLSASRVQHPEASATELEMSSDCDRGRKSWENNGPVTVVLSFVGGWLEDCQTNPKTKLKNSIGYFVKGAKGDANCPVGLQKDVIPATLRRAGYSRFSLLLNVLLAM